MCELARAPGVPSSAVIEPWPSVAPTATVSVVETGITIESASLKTIRKVSVAAETVAEIRRKDALTQADVAAKDLTTRAQLLHEARAAQHDRVQSAADAEQDRMHAQEKAKIELTAKKKAAKKPAAKK